LQPGDDVVAASKAILRDLWEDQQKRKKSRQQKLRGDIAASEKQVSGLLDRILETENPAVMGAYEQRIADLEKAAAVMREKLAEIGKQKLTFDDMFEHTIDVLSKPNEIWKKRDLHWKKMILKVVFSERMQYCRKTGLRTAKTTIPFKALACAHSSESEMVPTRPHV
jgi:hypothetical protein